MIRRLSPALAILALALSMAACNLGSAGPSAPADTTTSPAGPAAGVTSPAGSAPTSAPNNPAPSGSSSTPEACQNKYYPVVEGATWQYSMTGTVTSEFSRSITAVRSDGFTEQNVFASGPTATSEWECDDGALSDLSPDVGSSGSFAGTSGMKMDLHTTDSSGVTIPDNMGPGATWNQEIIYEGTMTVSGNEAKAKNNMKMDCTGGNTESVTVPAGTFDALRTECKIDSKITVTMSGAEIPTDVGTTATIWYAPGVGMIKTSETVPGGSPVTIELTSYKIP